MQLLQSRGAMRCVQLDARTVRPLSQSSSSSSLFCDHAGTVTNSPADSSVYDKAIGETTAEKLEGTSSGWMPIPFLRPFHISHVLLLHPCFAHSLPYSSPPPLEYR